MAKNVMKRVLIQTITGVYKHINTTLKNFKEKYAFDQKLPTDKRKHVYKKKAYYYEKENRALNLRRLKKRDKAEWEKAKKYDNYRDYVQSKEEQQDERRDVQQQLAREEKEEKKKKLAQDTPAHIRVWMKLKYTDHNPIFIESFIEGKAGDEQNLKGQLQSFIASNFGEAISLMSEIGIEKIKKAEKMTPQVNYKHNLTGSWSRF